MSGPYNIVYSGRFAFPTAPDVLWAMIEEPRNFERWWGWLHDLESTDEHITTGSVLTGVVDPPVPFTMQVRVTIDQYEPGRRIVASVGGDLQGPANLEISAPAGGNGTHVAIGWDVEMKQRRMRVAARVARPLLQWGHDRVVEAAVRGFGCQLPR